MNFFLVIIIGASPFLAMISNSFMSLTIGQGETHLQITNWLNNSIASSIASGLPRYQNRLQSSHHTLTSTMVATTNNLRAAANKAAADRRAKEKEAEKVAFAASRQQAQLDRENKKKQRDAERKAEEEKKKEEAKKKKEAEEKKKEAAKKKAKEAKEAAEAARRAKEADKPDENINDILHGLNEADKLAEEVLGEEEEGTNSPAKKKNKATSGNGSGGNLRSGKFATGSNNNSTRKATTTSKAQQKKQAAKVSPVVAPPHNHKHKRVILSGAIVLEGEDAYQEFAHAIAGMVTNGKHIDPSFVINPVTEGAEKDISSNKNISANMAILGKHVKVSGGDKNFKPTKVWTKYKVNPDGPDEFKPPTVYFSVAVSIDVDVPDFVDLLSIEWGRMGGIRLEQKALQSFSTISPLAIYLIWNRMHQATLIGEYTKILEEAKEIGEANEMLEDELFLTWASTPSFSLRLNVPRLPGQDTSVFNNYSTQLSHGRKVFHIECDKKDEEYLKKLTQIAKDNGLIEAMWGHHAHVSEVVTEKSSGGEIKRLISISQDHTNYQVTMTIEDLAGIVDLDKKVPFYDEEDPTREVGSMTLRYVFMNYVIMQDEHSLVAEIHQRGPAGLVEVVIPNIPAAETMVHMMNKNVAAYLINYLPQQGIPLTFVQALLKKSVEPELLANASECQWNSETWELTTAEELKEDSKRKDIKKAAWYKNETGRHMKEANKKKEKKYADPATLYDLDGDRSVKTIHERNDHRYAGDSGAPVIDLSDKFKDSTQKDKDDVIDLDEEESVMSNMSEKSSDNTTQGSAPNKDDDKSHSTTPVNGEEEAPNVGNNTNSSESSAASRASENAASSG